MKKLVIFLSIVLCLITITPLNSHSEDYNVVLGEKVECIFKTIRGEILLPELSIYYVSSKRVCVFNIYSDWGMIDSAVINIDDLNMMLKAINKFEEWNEISKKYKLQQYKETLWSKLNESVEINFLLFSDDPLFANDAVLELVIDNVKMAEIDMKKTKSSYYFDSDMVELLKHALTKALKEISVEPKYTNHPVFK
jgi:hypothetical protein